MPPGLSDNFNRMNIRSPINNNYREEEKRTMPTSINQPRFSNAENGALSKSRMSSIQDVYTPIRVLNQFSTDWRIRARVTKKGEQKQWKNQKGEGVLMNIELIDKEGT